MINPNDLTEDEYNNLNRELHKKITKAEDLTKEEQAFVCNSLHFDALLMFKFCLDEFFTKVFIARHSYVPKDLYILHERHHIAYDGLVREWLQEVNKTNHSDQLLQVIARETREELKSLRKEFNSLQSKITSNEYQKRKFKLLEWSKYRYIIIKDVFELLIKNDHYKLYLNQQEIIFDYYSLTHILTRHYGHVMKSYKTDKSYFKQDVHHERIHLVLENIFNRIDSSNVYKKNSVKEVNIRLNGILYKIYIEEESKGAIKFLRLNTFFPIDNKKMLVRLDKDYEERRVDNGLSVFVKKTSVSS